MMFVIISDVHSNLEALKKVIDTFPDSDGRTVISAGDTVGYGADPNECIDIISKISSVNVLGNHDAAVIDKKDMTNFNDKAKAAVLWTQDKISPLGIRYLNGLELVFQDKEITVVHGTLHSPEDFMYLMSAASAMHTFERLKTKVCFVGHSHKPGIYILRDGKVFESDKSLIKLEEGAKYIVNVGSVGQPRDKDPRACLLCI